MSNDPICPVCGESFPDEDYCPTDGIALVAEIADTEPPEASFGESSQSNGESDREVKVAGFMQRFGLRRARGRTDNVSEAGSFLPQELVEQGWQTSGTLHTSAAVDRWPVERLLEHETQRTGQFHRYRTPALTQHDLYQRLAADPVPQLVDVMAHGTVDLDGARADYELVSEVASGDGLDRWFADSSSSEQRARHVLPALVQLLSELERAGVQPLTLEPALLAWDSGDRLWLTRAGALAEANAADEYHADYAQSNLLNGTWAAPELTQDNMLTASAGVFALGQVLAQAVWGQPCAQSALQTGAIPFRQVADDYLARVLMGCLWPRSDGRWRLQELELATKASDVAATPEAPPWASLLPGAGSTAFSFAGGSYWRLGDILDAAAEPANWPEAAQRIREILEWAEDTPWQGQAVLMRRALDENHSADWVLVALRRVVRPRAPLTWRGLDLSDKEAARSLTGLAQRALRGDVKGDAEMLRSLFDADLRSAFSQHAVNHQDQNNPDSTAGK